MGLDAEHLTYWHEGRHHRLTLTGPDGGKVVLELFAT
ncbi:MAG: hypothetical protein R3C49_24995 [Planctomycetaceae bacterium]